MVNLSYGYFAVVLYELIRTETECKFCDDCKSIIDIGVILCTNVVN
jgi:hypothetical protein